MSGSVSPLPWTGSKGCIYTTIDAFMPPHKTYVEACMGSAEVFLRKKPVEREIINDYNGDLVKFFRVLQQNEKLAYLLGRLYLSFNIDNGVIAKLHTNKPLTSDDIKALEGILWSELGTKEEYEKEYQDKPLGVLVREIVGLDMNSAKEAFAKYLNEVNLDDRQIYFVNQIINYIVKNGMLADFKVLQETPFTDQGEVSDVFEDAVMWLDIMKIIKSINANAYAA